MKRHVDTNSISTPIVEKSISTIQTVTKVARRVALLTGASLTLFAGLLSRLSGRCRLPRWGILAALLFSLLGTGQAFAACNLSFTTSVGGQVTKSGSAYVYTFSQTDDNNCDAGANADGSGSGMGIYSDAGGSLQNAAGFAPTYPTTSSQAPSYSTANNVYVFSECCASGAANV